MNNNGDNFLIKALARRRKRIAPNSNSNDNNHQFFSKIKEIGKKQKNAAKKIQSRWKQYTKKRNRNIMLSRYNNTVSKTNTNNIGLMSEFFIKLAADNSNRKNNTIMQQERTINKLLVKLKLCKKLCKSQSDRRAKSNVRNRGLAKNSQTSIRRSARPRKSTKNKNYVYY